MNWLYGHTGKSFLDVWTIVHLSFWLSIGSVLWSRQRVTKRSYRSYFMWCLGVSYTWEIFERFAERRWTSLWMSPESWYNSWISDPLTCVIGVFFIWYALNHWRKQ